MRDLFGGKAGPAPAAVSAIPETQEAEPSFPGLAMDLDSLPPVPDVNLAEYDPLLDRARLHLVLAAKALQNLDTSATVDECNLAYQKLDRASYLPNIDQDSNYAELTHWVMSLYQRCAPAISARGLDVPMAAVKAMMDHPAQADTAVDLSKLTFKEPPPTTIPLPMNEEVERNIVYFSARMKGTFGKWIERSGKYFPVMQPILKEEGMPPEIIFLTMIESGVNPIARSWAKCVGLWQFSKATGESYGLHGDWFTDDRRNPEKSTRAAARHLRDLFNRYNDWHLALAAYNAGAGRIDRALQRSRVKNPNYWDIQEFLPTETQHYVPRYVAAAIIGLNPASYDFAELKYEKPLEYDVVTVDKAYKLEDLADCVGLTADELQEYNPFLLQPVTPPEAKSFELRVPKGRAQTFASNISNVSSVKVAEVEQHKVKRGETIFKLAKMFGVSVDQIKKANNMSHTRRLAPGEMLRIPKMPSVDNLSYVTAMDNLASGSNSALPDPMRRTSGREKTTITVEQGMTLGGIANRFNVMVFDLMTWNGIRSGDPLVPGRELAVWLRPGAREKTPEELAAEDAEARQIAAAELKAVSRPREERPAVRAVSAKSGKAELHRVAHGETLAGIADKYGVSVTKLRNWNQLRNAKARPGKVLRIYQEPVAPREPVFAATADRPEPLTDGLDDDPGTQEDASDGDASEGGEGSAERGPVATAEAGSATHVVKKGETLWSVAAEHGVSTEQVRTWNKLQGDAIQAGRLLVVGNGEKPTAQGAATVKHAATDADVADARQAAAAKGTQVAPAAPFAGRSGVTRSEKATTYVVKKGDNLWSIAKSVGVRVEQLSLWNSLKDMQVQAGQELHLTDTRSIASNRPPETVGAEKAAEKTQPAPVSRSGGSYLVKKGDNLFSIAREAGVSVDQLRAWNGLDDGSIKAGQELRLSAPVQSAASNIEQQPKTAPRLYVVKDGDTLYSISKKLGVSVSELQRWNDVGEALRPGQELSYQQH